MRIPRIFYPHKIGFNTEIILDISSSNHLLNVLRLELNSSVILFNGEGGEFTTKIIALKNHRAIIKVMNFTSKDVESPIKIHLAQGIGRGEKMDYVIQKAVELGVYKITPLFTEYCNVKLNEEKIEKRLAHWQAVIISACEQSSRNYLPQINAPQNLTNWLNQKNDSLKIVLDPKATTSLAKISAIPSEVTVLIGPEGGLSTNEIELTQKNNFKAASLGPRILRTETASLAAISVLQAKFGDFK